MDGLVHTLVIETFLQTLGACLRCKVCRKWQMTVDRDQRGSWHWRCRYCRRSRRSLLG